MVKGQYEVCLYRKVHDSATGYSEDRCVTRLQFVETAGEAAELVISINNALGVTYKDGMITKESPGGFLCMYR